jgi:hypothetical protein
MCPTGCQMCVRSWLAWESRSVRPLRWRERSDCPCACSRHACVGDEVPAVADVEEAKVQTGSRAHTRRDCPNTDPNGQEGADQGLAFLVGRQHNGQTPNVRRHESCPQPCGRGAALNAGRIEGPSPGAGSQSPSARLVGLVRSRTFYSAPRQMHRPGDDQLSARQPRLHSSRVIWLCIRLRARDTDPRSTTLKRSGLPNTRSTGWLQSRTVRHPRIMSINLESSTLNSNRVHHPSPSHPKRSQPQAQHILAHEHTRSAPHLKNLEHTPLRADGLLTSRAKETKVSLALAV